MSQKQHFKIIREIFNDILRQQHKQRSSHPEKSESVIFFYFEDHEKQIVHLGDYSQLWGYSKQN